MPLPRQSDFRSIRHPPRSVRGVEVAGGELDAGQLQGVPISTESPEEGEVLVLRGNTFIPESLAVATIVGPHGDASHLINYEVSPSPFDAIVDGFGVRTGHYAEITDAIAASAKSIYVRLHPLGWRYDAFTVASGDAAVAIVGAGPGVLVGAITVEKDEVFLSDLESNGRFTLTALFCNFLRIICRATGNTGFTMSDVYPDVAGDSTFTDCAVLEANAGVAFDFGNANHGIRLVNFTVRNFTGQHVIEAQQPDHFITRLNIANTSVAPTQEPILIDGTGGSGPFILVDSDLGCSVPNTFNLLKAVEVSYLLVANIGALNEAPDATPAIKLDHTLGGNYFVNLKATGVTTLFDIPAASTGLTVLSDCIAGATLVTGTGKREIRSCKQGAANVGDYYDGYNLSRVTDNTGSIGSVVVAWADVNAYIYRVRDYIDFKLVTAPADPAMAGILQASREYTRAIDADNDGLYIKIKQAGSIIEQALTPQNVVCHNNAVICHNNNMVYV